VDTIWQQQNQCLFRNDHTVIWYIWEVWVTFDTIRSNKVFVAVDYSCMLFVMASSLVV